MKPMVASPSPQPVLRRYILSWTLGALLLVWLTLIAVAWSTGFREARKFSDGQLVAVAKLWLEASPTGAGQYLVPASARVDHEYLQDVAVLAWEDGRLVADTHDIAQGLDLASLPPRGFRTLTLQTRHGLGEWRSYGVSLEMGGRNRRVLALMDMKKRGELGKDIAEHVAQPAILILPLVALLLWWTIRRGLRPLDQLSSEVAALDGFAGQRLDTRHRFREFTSTVSAINTLVDTLQKQAQREREFASDVAHELRTPHPVAVAGPGARAAHRQRGAVQPAGDAGRRARRARGAVDFEPCAAGVRNGSRAVPAAARAAGACIGPAHVAGAGPAQPDRKRPAPHARRHPGVGRNLALIRRLRRVRVRRRSTRGLGCCLRSVRARPGSGPAPGGAHRRTDGRHAGARCGRAAHEHAVQSALGTLRTLDSWRNRLA